MARPRYKLYHNIYISDFQLYRPESVSLASLARQLLHRSVWNMYRLLHAFECNLDIISRVNDEVISQGEAECNLAISE